MWRARCVDFVRSRWNAQTLYCIGLGQLLSLLVTGTGITSSLLAAGGVNMPTTQSLINYVLLCIYAIPWIKREGWDAVRHVLRNKWWIYLGLAFLDVEANFVAVMAYQYTTLSSAMLLDCVSIPAVMVLGYFFLVHRFQWPQYVGVAMCVAGVVALVLSDWLEGAFTGTHNAQNMLLGDGLVILAALLYAASNTGQEKQVASSKLEYMCLLGVFGTPICAIQAAILDHGTWTSVTWSGSTVGLMLGYAACLFAIYSLVPIVLVMSGATFLNLSLLTSDVLAIIVGVLLFHYTLSLWYLLASLLILAGLVVYNIGAHRASSDKTPLVAVVESPSSASERSIDGEADDDVTSL